MEKKKWERGEKGKLKAIMMEKKNDNVTGVQRKRTYTVREKTIRPLPANMLYIRLLHARANS